MFWLMRRVIESRVISVAPSSSSPISSSFVSVFILSSGWVVYGLIFRACVLFSAKAFLITYTADDFLSVILFYTVNFRLNCFA